MGRVKIDSMMKSNDIQPELSKLVGHLGPNLNKLGGMAARFFLGEFTKEETCRFKPGENVVISFNDPATWTGIPDHPF